MGVMENLMTLLSKKAGRFETASLASQRALTTRLPLGLYHSFVNLMTNSLGRLLVSFDKTEVLQLSTSRTSHVFSKRYSIWLSRGDGGALGVVSWFQPNVYAFKRDDRLTSEPVLESPSSSQLGKVWNSNLDQRCLYTVKASIYSFAKNQESELNASISILNNRALSPIFFSLRYSFKNIEGQSSLERTAGSLWRRPRGLLKFYTSIRITKP
ncbi:hypothetical protein VNO77_44000 [Canavalia gladiata]|uniref:Uncharacterized protein n=1 Tax=Canavalia gladiata TaxID=3824 RepID=A0AAN9PNE2_CANGL